MTRLGGAEVEAMVEAAFDRYNQAVLSGLEPTISRFIESLEAEGLVLSVASAPVGQRHVADSFRPVSGPDRRRMARRLTDHLKGLT